MLNSRIIFISPKNASSGRVSLQQSDVEDVVNGSMKYLLVVEKGNDITTAETYTGKELEELIGRALLNGKIINKDNGSIFYLADRK